VYYTQQGIAVYFTQQGIAVYYTQQGIVVYDKTWAVAFCLNIILDADSDYHAPEFKTIGATTKVSGKMLSIHFTWKFSLS